MKKLGAVLTLCAVTCAFSLAPAQNAEARPPYQKAFNDLYGKVEKVKEQSDELKCGLCHGEGGKNKKVLSDYAKALAEALGEKNVKKAEQIEKAFKTIEEKKQDEKTYKELLEAGELPKLAPEKAE